MADVTHCTDVQLPKMDTNGIVTTAWRQPLSRLAQVAVGVLEETKGVIGAIQGALEVAQYDVDPSRPFSFGGRTTVCALDNGTLAKLLTSA